MGSPAPLHAALVQRTSLLQSHIGAASPRGRALCEKLCVPLLSHVGRCDLQGQKHVTGTLWQVTRVTQVARGRLGMEDFSVRLWSLERPQLAGGTGTAGGIDPEVHRHTAGTGHCRGNLCCFQALVVSPVPSFFLQLPKNKFFDPRGSPPFSQGWVLPCTVIPPSKDGTPPPSAPGAAGTGNFSLSMEISSGGVSLPREAPCSSLLIFSCCCVSEQTCTH